MRRRGKRGGTVIATAIACAAWAASGAAMAADGTLPHGGTVTMGQAAINQSGLTTTIQQSSAKAAIDWQSFGIGKDATVNFVQPSTASVTLNRVIGADATQIFGRLHANGQVFIINPNGILFAPGAQVNAAGILASTRDISNADFAAGRYRFSGNSTAKVENQGSLNATDGGYVVLFGAQVSNTGNISARAGDVRLAAANEVTVRLDGNQLAGFTVTQGTLDGLAENKGLIRAEGGRIYLTAEGLDQLARAVVNNEGIVEAASIASQGGQIVLQGDVVNNTGTVKASVADGASGQQAGTIALQGRSVLQAGHVRADGGNGHVLLAASQSLMQTQGAVTSASGGQQGGSVRIDGGESAWLSGNVHAEGAAGGDVVATAKSVTLSSATLSADGTQSGGRVRVGGGAHGASVAGPDGGFANAQTTQINTTSSLSAAGEGGQVVAWSDDTTQYAGTATTGSHGFIEISGKGDLRYAGKANPGQGGRLLLDPTNITIGAGGSATDYIVLADPNPAANDQHGSGGVLTLSNGNIVVASPHDSFGGTSAGAVYLYDGTSGALISALYGSHSNDYIGLQGITALTNGNFVVRSSQWTNGSATYAGAVTWSNGTTGLNGIVSSSNSLVGTNASDYVGNTSITALNNGNYVVASSNWKNGSNASAGAVTWANGSTGITGAVSSANSLVGSNANDAVGSAGVTALSNGNYVVRSPNWKNGANAYAGAVTWGNGTTGISGVVGSGNSLVGTNASDYVGNAGVTALTNGNYVVGSSSWKNGTAAAAGAATWSDGTTGITGTISAQNSLVGSNAGDAVGQYITALPNGNYVVRSPNWKNGGNAYAGAVTWGNGSAGVKGAVTSANSLVGSNASDYVGNNRITVLSNGNYVVVSSNWKNGSNASAGAVTWGSATDGVRGAVSSANSLVGSNASDQVGSGGVAALTNGNYVVRSPNWKNGSNAYAGAATWGNGGTGVKGAVTSLNSLVGTHANDHVSSAGVTALSNGNYVVASPSWTNGTTASTGAATWGNGSEGTTGAVSTANSLVGTTANDQVGQGGVTALTNGNYVVSSPYWNNGSATHAGAATWGDGTSGIIGAVGSGNSLVGGSANDMVSFSGGYYYGYGYNQGSAPGITALTNGNYVVVSPYWKNGSATYAGAVTWGNGTTGVKGLVTSSNSLVGTKQNDMVGLNVANYYFDDFYYYDYSNGASPYTWTGVTALANGNYVVSSNYWSNGTATNAGAVTWGNGTTGVTGELSSTNSLVGSHTSDLVGLTYPYSYSYYGSNALDSGIVASGTGKYLIRSQWWSNGTSGYAGSVVLADATHPVTGVLGGLSGPAVGEYTPAQVAALAVAGTTTTLSATNNVTVNSAVTVEGTLKLTGGNTVTLNAGITSNASGTALVLSGQKFVNNAGSTALSTPNGRWLVWSATPANDTRGGLAYDFKQYGATYGSSDVLGLGNGFLYSITPTLTASLTGSVTKTYDARVTAPLASSNLTSTGTIDGDTVSLKATSATYANANAGTGKNVTATGVSVDQATNGTAWVYGYQLASTQATGAVGTVNKATVSVAHLVASDKVYDGTDAVTIESSALTGLFGGDTLTLTSTGAAFDTKNVGTGKTVTLSGLGLANGAGLAANYQLASATATTTASITPKTLTVSGLTAADKVYDGNVSAQLVGSASLSGVVSGDVGKVAVSGTATAAFADKNVGTAKPVTVGGLALGAGMGGDESGNYVLASTAPVTASITPKSITVSGSNVSKTYDGTTAMEAGVSGFAAAATVASNASISSDGKSIAGDDITYVGEAAFASKDAGSRAVTRNTVALKGADANNYTVNWVDGNGTITPKALTMMANDSAKVLTDVDPTLTAKYTGFVKGEDASVLSGVSVTRAAGESAGNYTITPTATSSNYTITAVPGTFTVQPADTLLVKMGDATQVYGDTMPGLTAASAVYYSSGSSALRTLTLNHVGNDWTGSDGLGGGISFTASTTATSGSGVGNYAINVSNLQSTGVANYTSSIAAPGNLSVTPRQVVVNHSATPTKVYDGDTSLSNLTLSIGNKVGSDNVSVSGSASYNARNAGTGLGYSVSDLKLTGTAAENYYLASSSLTGTDGIITPKAVTAIGATGINKTYDRSTALASSATGYTFDASQIVAGDRAGLTGAAAYSSANAGARGIVAGSLALAGTDAANYTLSFTQGSGTITAKSIDVVGLSGINRTYDGTTAITGTSYMVGSGQVVSGDTVNVTGAAAYDSKNAGSRTVVQGTLALDNANYSMNFINGSGTISRANVSVSGVTVADKVYDGTVNATATGFTGLTGVVGSDSVSLDTTAAVAAFDSRNVGSGKTVTVNHIALGGTDAANYLLEGGTATTAASITPKALAVQATASNKVYDGTTTASVALESNGVVNGDAITFTPANAVFADKNAGTGKTVTVTGITLDGADAANYTLAATHTSTSADITPLAITVSATGSNKVYDGNNSASATLSSSHVLSGDTVSFSGTAAYADKNAGTGKTITVSDIVATGTDAGNYNVGTTATTTGNITAKAITVTATGVNKVYDGSTDASVVLASSGIVAGDTVNFSGDASFADKNAASGKTVSVSGIARDGADAGNYSLNNTTAITTANITPRQITVNATGVNKVYDGATHADVLLASGGVLSGDEVAFQGTANFSDKNAGTAKQVSVQAIGKTGTDAGNYSLAATTAETTADVTPKQLTVNASGIGKVYDGAATARVALNSTDVLGDDVVVYHGTATFADKNAGTGKAVTVSGITITGGSAGNYALSSDTAQATADITPKAISVALAGDVSKRQDGNVSASLAPANFRISGLVAGEAMTVTRTGGAFDSLAIGKGKGVTTTIGAADYEAGGGTLLGNYSLFEGTLTAAVGEIKPSFNLDAAITSIPALPSGASVVNGFTAPQPAVATASSGTTPSNGNGGGSQQGTQSTAGTEESTSSSSGDTKTKKVDIASSSSGAPTIPMRRTFSIGDGGIRLPAGVRYED